MIQRPRLFISFSGGRTSALMTMLLLIMYGRTHESVVLFANTGAEHEKTLRFVHLCDTILGFGTVWVEAVINPGHGEGTTHRVVTFKMASRAAEPFEEMIKKYGIPNKNYPHCTRELKLHPMTSYLRSIGWEPGSYQTAVGIRADEADRISSTAGEKGIIYHLVKIGVKVPFVKRWWRAQLFDLEIDEIEGNCRWCWKKTKRKLLTLAKRDPAIFDFPARMEREHANSGAGDGGRVFYRGGESARDILAQSLRPFTPWNGELPLFGSDGYDDTMDVGGACGDTCEIGADE